ncbi:MAG: DNA repair protein RecO [Pyrinomonadaceae bacterium]
MSLIETESVVLKSYNLAEADRIVVFLTQDHGVVRGVAKGAKRLKSKFGSSLEPFSIVRMTYFEKESQELVSIDRAEIVRSNFSSASDPEFLQKFSYLGDLLISVSPPHDPNETLYRMAKACLDTASADHSSLESTGVYFELWLMKLAGYLPDWSSCDRCRRIFADNEDAPVLTNFHFICSSCRRSTSLRVMPGVNRPLAASALKLSPSSFAKASSGRAEELKDLSKMLKQLIASSLGREVAAEMSLRTVN